MEDILTESRGLKRQELDEELPADKRACSSLESRPSSSNATPPAVVNSSTAVFDVHVADMDTSSAASVSGRSESDGDRDSQYGSEDDMDDDDPRYSSLRAIQRNRAHDDILKFNAVISNLSNEAEPSGQLAALTELCELLSFCTEDSISIRICNQLAPLLVMLAKHEDNPELMLLAIRALGYLCDVLQSSSSILVRHNAVPALCQRLMVIEYLDVAEECLQALEKISLRQPLPCMQSGAIMAVLGYLEFFSTTIQRTALGTVVNICKKLPAECPSSVMEAVPRLCNLLQCEDQQLVELVATCLIKIVDRVKNSSQMLSELCCRGIIDQVTQLIDVNSRITLSQPTYTGLVGILANITRGSANAVSTLYELNIGSILKDALSSSDLSHGLLSSHAVEKTCNQVYEILRLLHELVPEVARDRKEVQVSSKEKICLDQPDRFDKFVMEILPTLMQVVSSGSNLTVCYGSMSVISRLVYFSRSETLSEMFEVINIASFLVGVFTRNDDHILSVALDIAQTVLEKLPNVMMQSFIKEGVLFGIDALLIPESSSKFTSPMVSCIQSKRGAGREVTRCFCYAYCNRQSKSTNDDEICKIDGSSVHKLAQHIKTKYFSKDLHCSQASVTDVLQDLRNVSAAMTDLVLRCQSRESSVQDEEKLCSMLHKVILQLGGTEPISTFELIESGILKALLTYLSNGLYLSRLNGPDNDTQAYDLQKRFENFARLCLSSEAGSKDTALCLLVRKLQSALLTAENFPVILGCMTRQRGSHATVPSGRSTSYPCLKVRFVKGEEELHLNDYVPNVLTVDPFCLIDDIEQYLLPKVSQRKVESSGGGAEVSVEGNVPVEISVDVGSVPVRSVQHVGSKQLRKFLSDVQKGGDCKSDCSPVQESDVGQTIVDGTTVMIAAKNVSSGVHSFGASTDLMASTLVCLSGNDEDIETAQCQTSFSNSEVPSKLVLYLDGEPLENSSTLYQEVIQRLMKSQSELNKISNLWSNTYTVTYKRSVGNEASWDKGQNHFHGSVSSDIMLSEPVAPLLSSIFSQRLGSSVNSLSPTSDILILLRCLEIMNRLADQLVYCERLSAYSTGKIDDLEYIRAILTVPQYEFVSSKLTEKLEQQMRDPSTIHVGAMPLWCSQLMADCPFLFSFEARCKYFQLAALGKLQMQPNNSSHSASDASRDRRTLLGSLSRKKFLVCRDHILESASQMMDQYISKKVAIEVEYSEEVGTGLGPTLEFFTLVSQEFQKPGLGMWRGDYMSAANSQGSCSSALFPRPWSPTRSNINGIEFSNVIRNYMLLGQFVGKALQDGRVLDIPLSKAFYKLILGKELSLCDIQSFDQELGKTLLELKALISRQKNMKVSCVEDVAHGVSSGFCGANIEDLCLDFTLPGYPDYILACGMDDVPVTTSNLEEYVSLVLDATLCTGISRQIEAFKSGLNQVIAGKHLHIFDEEEMERLLCGEHESWMLSDLFDHINFDHGYTASSPPIINLLEVISEFDYQQRRDFLQFVTGAPRLPPGGLATLTPKLTIVRKDSSNSVDIDLPSVMTCHNYLKLPPYSSKEKMKEKLLYAISEGQGCFHLS